MATDQANDPPIAPDGFESQPDQAPTEGPQPAYPQCNDQAPSQPPTSPSHENSSYPDPGLNNPSYQGPAAVPVSQAGHSAIPYPNSPPTFDTNIHAIDERLRPHSSAEQVAQGVLRLSDQPAIESQQSPEDHVRKRNKVSRACDECRRKKIRCDAPTETGEVPCSTCRRVNIPCQFNRAPQKRGPNRGYIRDLSDRLNTLESQIGSGGPLGLSQSDLQLESDYRHDPMRNSPSLSSRKRKYSFSEATSFARDTHTVASLSRIPAFTGPDSDRHTQSSAKQPPNLENPFLPSSHPKSTEIQSSTRGDGLDGPNADYTQDQESREHEASNTFGPDQEALIEEYYRLIHPTYPLLSNKRPNLRARLRSCSHTLSEAFWTALQFLIHTLPSSRLSPLSDPKQVMKRASELIAECQFESSASQLLTSNLVYIQILILMILQSDNFGPASRHGRFGPPRAEWLGRAIGMVTHLKLNLLHSPEATEGADTDEELGRRSWWILFILDRWHASSTSSLLQLPDNSCKLLRQDESILGDSTYHLVRLSYILGHLSMILQQPPSLMSSTSNASPIITNTIVGELERFRESVDSRLPRMSDLVHLSYWHVRLIVSSLTSSTNPLEIAVPATQVAMILNSASPNITPLNHHFAALAALMLVELLNVEETRAVAQKGIEDLAEALYEERGSKPGEEGARWNSAIRELVSKTRRPVRDAAQSRAPHPDHTADGLQHLADAAIRGNGHSHRQAAGDQSSAQSSSVFDPAAITRYGYLAVLAP